MASEKFTDVIPSEEIIQYLHPSLLDLDYNDTKVKAVLIIGTLLAYTVQFFLTNVFINQLSAFKHLRSKHRIFMSLAVSRGVYGITCIIFGCYALMMDTNLSRDVVFGKTATGHFAMTYTVGFFIFELTAVILSDVVFKTFSKLLIIHHSLALISFAQATHYGVTFSFGCRGLLLEMSTPFSCLCFVLLKAGKERLALWKINQLLLVHTFHLRSVVEFYLLYVTYHNWAYIWADMPKAVFVCLYFSLFITTFWLTPYWGYKKTQQLFNPVDWNFQESTNSSLTNGQPKKVV